MKKSKKEVRELFRITSDEYPKGLPGKKLYPIGETIPFSKDICLKIKEVFWAKTFYGPNNMYSAWTSGYLFEDGKYRTQGPMGISKDKGFDIVWMTELPKAYVDQQYKVSVAYKIHEALGYTEETRSKEPWTLSNLITYHTTKQLEKMFEDKSYEQKREELLVMHK